MLKLSMRGITKSFGGRQVIAPPNVMVVSTFIMSQFEQGSVSVGMAIAVLTMAISVTALLVLQTVVGRERRQ